MKTRLLLPAFFFIAAAASFAAEPDPGYVAHEWGTFTSVQGADGVQMEWNPLVVSELPKFVYDRTSGRTFRTPVVAGKIGFTCRQRMETPVIYFYSDRARTVDVSVRFPAGTVTEWYPLELAGDTRTPEVRRASGKDQPVLQWPALQILPASADASPLITEASGSHYYAARETDASLVRTTSGKKTETEKFLFYRGVGQFQAPLTVQLGSSDARQVSLANSGTEDLQSLFLYEVRADGAVAWLPIDKLAAGATQIADLGTAPGAGAESLAAALRTALVRQGLYEKEAAAMVKTWESSWFSERGMRVLYTLPRAWTDRTLPLAITPAPKGLERVMVGRAEVITPAMEQALLDAVNRYVAATAPDRAKIVAETRALGLGRFTEAALRRLLVGAQRSREFSSLSWELLQASSKPDPRTAAAN